MLCTNCGSDNPGDAAFCEQCGRPLELICPACQTPVTAGARFCKRCGASLNAGSSRSAPKPALGGEIRLSADGTSATVADGERKTVTALFGDIKGSMELMENLDPEEARAIVDPALRLMIDAVHRYGGHIVQSTGDGIFALFGAPVAHEDHPQRALYAALRMQEEIRRYGDRMRARGQAPIQLRIGANTGEVVVRSIQTDVGHAEYTPIGHSTSLAARLQTLATPGSTVISGHTRRVVEGYFQLKELGATPIKGVSEPVELFEVIGLGLLRTRLQAAVRRGLTKFVGREAELGRMRQALDSAHAEHGQIVAVIGEAGVGKSRLFFEFKAIVESGCLVLEAYSVSHGRASAYLPVNELLRQYFEISSTDDERKRRERILGKLIALDPALEDAPPYLYPLMGVAEANHSLAQMDPQIRRRRTQEAIKRIFIRESLNQPLIIIFEDLHWIDDETQALLNHVVEAIANARILLLVNYRPEYRHEWGSRTHYTQLRLDPLGRDSAGEMLSALLGDEPELDSLKRLITGRTEGNPFFVEEMVQALFEQGVLARNGRVSLRRSLAEVKIPPTVQAVLAARIDRLPPAEKELLQTMAIVGREFTLPLIHRVTGTSEAQLEALVGDLQSGEFIYEQPAFPELEYSFKHALTQEVAYNSVLIERRRVLHERTANAMETVYAGSLESRLSELARHYQRGGNNGKALEYLRRAGQQAVTFSSHAEAIELFTLALELLKTLPETPESMQQELALQLLLGSSLTAVKGFGAPETARPFSRASDLSGRIGTTPQIFAVLAGLNIVNNGRGAREGYKFAQELGAIAESEQDAVLLVIANICLAYDLCLMGDFVRARNYAERAVSLYNPAHLESYFAVYPICDPGLVASYCSGFALCCLGYPERALACSREGLALARKSSNAFTFVAGPMLSAVVDVLRRDAQAGLKLIDEALRVATESGFQQIAAACIAYKGCMLIELGRAEEGIVQLEEGIEEWRASAAEGTQTFFVAMLADGYRQLGRIPEGLNAVAEGLAISERTGERWYDAELYRIKGESLLQQQASAGSDVTSEAQACFQRACDIAQRQQAKWWELRSTVSLARLLAKQDRRDEARTLLGDIYNWFTEGFDTADLRGAQVLLEEVGGRLQ